MSSHSGRYAAHRLDVVECGYTEWESSAAIPAMAGYASPTGVTDADGIGR
jgi:hypothetical protein